MKPDKRKVDQKSRSQVGYDFWAFTLSDNVTVMQTIECEARTLSIVCDILTEKNNKEHI